MKTKTFYYVAVPPFLVFLCIILLDIYLPKEITFEKPVAIADSVTSVFKKINTTGNWKQWMAWSKPDTGKSILYFGAVEGEGAGIEWPESENMPSGKFIIRKSFPPDSILYEIVSGNSGTGCGKMYLKKYSGGTYLTWSFRLAGVNSLIGRYRLIGLKKKLLELTEISEGYLKSICEYEATHHIDMDFTNLPECDYLYIRDECFSPEISDRISNHFSSILKYMAQQNIKQKGFPFCIYHKVSDTMIFSTCIPVENIKQDIPATDKIKSGHLSPDEAIVANYHGDYSALGNAHSAVQQWITEGNKKITGDPIEMYLTGPAEIADSSRWFTKIYYPVK